MITALRRIIHVIAGNGILGYSGDGGPATSASVSFAVGVAVVPAGDSVSVYLTVAGQASPGVTMAVK